MDSCICMAESLHCSPEIITTMLISSIQYKIKKFKVWGKKKILSWKTSSASVDRCQVLSTDPKAQEDSGLKS